MKLNKPRHALRCDRQEVECFKMGFIYLELKKKTRERERENIQIHTSLTYVYARSTPDVMRLYNVDDIDKTFRCLATERVHI